MRFFSTFIGAVAAATTVLSSPVTPTPRPEVVAGHIVTNKGVTYGMTDLNEIKVFDGKVDNGEYPYPLEYKVESGFHCIFYHESTRGPGSSIGEFDGPVEGKFDEWIECYKCWAQASKEDTKAVAVRDGPDDSGIPCGFVRTPDGATHALENTGNDVSDVTDFGVKGAYYYPECFHVTEGCTCRFYTVRNSRSGPEKISENKGVANGTFEPGEAARYVCWTGA